MSKMLGLNFVIKIGWIKKAVSLLYENLPEKEYKEQLEKHLSYEIESPTNLRKVRETLMRIWYLDSDDVKSLQEEGRKLVQEFPDYISAISWCMIPLAYPLFSDVAKIMGKMFEFDDIITTAQIRNKLFDEYGERSAIEHTTSKIISTMRELGCVKSLSTGKQTVSKISINNSEITIFMVKIAMYLNGCSYYAFSSLSEFAFLFPFEYKLTKEAILQDEKLVMTNFGGELSLSLKDQAF